MRPLKYPLAHLSPAKDELVVIEISRAAVDSGDPRLTLEKLQWLSASRESCLQWEGKLTFYFAGWGHDPRETAEIPEIRAFFQAVTAQWPHWLHFCEKVDDTVMHVLRLLCHGHYLRRQPRTVLWQFADPNEIPNQLMRLFSGQNALYDRFHLPETLNERITQEVGELIENTFAAGNWE